MSPLSITTLTPFVFPAAHVSLTNAHNPETRISTTMAEFSSLRRFPPPFDLSNLRLRVGHPAVLGVAPQRRVDPVTNCRNARVDAVVRCLAAIRPPANDTHLDPGTGSALRHQERAATVAHARAERPL